MKNRKDTIGTYIHRYAYPYLLSTLPKVNEHLKIAIVIPCYKELNIIKTLSDIAINDIPNEIGVEVVVVINDSDRDNEDIHQLNDQTLQNVKAFSTGLSHALLTIIPIRVPSLPNKQAGVGLARKIGLDIAVQRMYNRGVEDGILVCLDADSRINVDYIVSIWDHFQSYPESIACSIHFEHPLERSKYGGSVIEAIIQYELHLRYFIEMQRRLQLPYAYHTVGSSMAVRLKAYCAVGGMNKRKAGEDFYFYHKFVKKGLVTELRDTTVYPSPRISDRVPFGTGKAVGELIDKKVYETYHPSSFMAIDYWLKLLPRIFHENDVQRVIQVIAPPLISFLELQNFEERIQEIKQNTSDWQSFQKRFYNWFDAFLLMKCLHYLRDASFPLLSISDAVRIVHPEVAFDSAEAMLLHYRSLDKIRPMYHAT